MTKQQRFYHVGNILQEIAGMALEGDHSINYKWAAHVQWFDVWFYPFLASEGDDYAFCSSIHIDSDKRMESDLDRLLEALHQNDLLYTQTNN
jgi:hypothetical protein